MTDIEPEEELPPVAHVTLVYNGPVAPHWEMKVRYGDQKMLDEFWTRVYARLLLLPKHDPQFRRNRERVNRDAERELIICDWDLGEDDAETTSTPPAPQAEVVVEGEEVHQDEEAHQDTEAQIEEPTTDDADEVGAEVSSEPADEVGAEDGVVDTDEAGADVGPEPADEVGVDEGVVDTDEASAEEGAESIEIPASQG